MTGFWVDQVLVDYAAADHLVLHEVRNLVLVTLDMRQVRGQDLAARLLGRVDHVCLHGEPSVMLRLERNYEVFQANFRPFPRLEWDPLVDGVMRQGQFQLKLERVRGSVVIEE